MRRFSSVQSSVLDCLGNVVYLNFSRTLKICNGSGNLQDSVVGPRRKAEFVNGRFKNTG